MKLSISQKNELEVWKYFIPKNCVWGQETEKDIQMFFEWSEQGKHKGSKKYNDNDIVNIPTYKVEGRTYFHALIWGKKRAGIHVHELYEQGVLKGGFPYVCVLNIEPYGQKIPIEVKDFLKKEMFQGIDSDLIDELYNEY